MTLWFGGDYNPEQWPEDVWDDDVRLMKRAGVTVATVGVFSWARIEPAEGRFDFGWLDDVIGRLHRGGIRVDLATATASPPPWMVKNHPDILPVTSSGVRLAGGSRQHYSPSSSTYRRLAGRLVRAMAERYGNHPALVAWHVNNEFGCHVNRCYSEESAAAFRSWLERKYGTIGRLNEAWGTAFWSQSYGAFAEVEPPRDAPTYCNPTQLIDFDRFSSDALKSLLSSEVAILREVSPNIPITTNFMGPFKPLDYWSWAQEIDFVSDDSYPDPADPLSPVSAAMSRDLMRSLGGGKPWILMEQAPSAVNWRTVNLPKPPGGNRVLSLQSIARGADGIMYFQWRQSVSGSEKFHSAMVPHAGPETRVFREVEELGAELGEMAWIEGCRVQARVAIVIDWDSWWAIEQSSNPATLEYLRIVSDWYRAFWELSVTVDFVRAGADLSAYAVVVAPALFVAAEDHLSRLGDYVDAGGNLVVSFQSGILDPDLRITRGGYLGPLRDTLGVRVEEFAPLSEGSSTITKDSARLNVSLWTEYVHAEGAEVLARFDEGDVAGRPAITRSARGTGAAWYVATHPDGEGLKALAGDILAETSVRPVLDESGEGVEAVVRGDATFVINHRGEPRTVRLRGETRELEPREVVIERGPVLNP